MTTLSPIVTATRAAPQTASEAIESIEAQVGNVRGIERLCASLPEEPKLGRREQLKVWSGWKQPPASVLVGATEFIRTAVTAAQAAASERGFTAGDILLAESCRALLNTLTAASRAEPAVTSVIEPFVRDSDAVPEAARTRTTKLRTVKEKLSIENLDALSKKDFENLAPSYKESLFEKGGESYRDAADARALYTRLYGAPKAIGPECIGAVGDPRIDDANTAAELAVTIAAAIAYKDSGWSWSMSDSVTQSPYVEQGKVAEVLAAARDGEHSAIDRVLIGQTAKRLADTFDSNGVLGAATYLALRELEAIGAAQPQAAQGQVQAYDKLLGLAVDAALRGVPKGTRERELPRNPFDTIFFY